jgi:hypothetical protein
MLHQSTFVFDNWWIFILFEGIWEELDSSLWIKLVKILKAIPPSIWYAKLAEISIQGYLWWLCSCIFSCFRASFFSSILIIFSRCFCSSSSRLFKTEKSGFSASSICLLTIGAICKMRSSSSIVAADLFLPV